jgi:hypothetical protein
MPISARGLAAAACAALAIMTMTAIAQEMPIPPANPPAKRIITQGLASPTIDNLFKCEVPVTNHRISAMGTIKAQDGAELTVPVVNQYQTGRLKTPRSSRSTRTARW